MEGKLLFFGDPSPLFYARLHLGLGGRIGNRQAQRREGDEARADVVEVVLDGLELPAHFARDQRRIIGRQAGIEDRGGHKQALVWFPSPLFYARPPASTNRDSDPGGLGADPAQACRLICPVAAHLPLRSAVGQCIVAAESNR